MCAEHELTERLRLIIDLIGRSGSEIVSNIHVEAQFPFSIIDTRAKACELAQPRVILTLSDIDIGITALRSLG